MVRANTLVEPPGSAASAVAVPARPLAASLSVPSPPEHDDHVGAVGGRALGQPGGVAAPAGLGHRDLVVGGERLLDHDPPARVTEDAEELTSSSSFKPPNLREAADRQGPWEWERMAAASSSRRRRSASASPACSPADAASE